MKKGLILVVLVSITGVFGVSAAAPKVLAFTIGAAPNFEFAQKQISAGYYFGVDVSFNETFFGGFKFIDLTAMNLNLINLSVEPVDRLRIDTYVGAATVAAGASPTTNMAFGADVGFQAFNNADSSQGFFSSFTVKLMWLATSAAKGLPFSMQNGGGLSIGLETQIGL